MRIQDIEIANFRRLRAVRIELADETTLFVGANNSGKTSAMVALRRFLVRGQKFGVHDISLVHWPTIMNIGRQWETDEGSLDASRVLADWATVAPYLDLWLNVADDELHHVAKIIPTLDWSGGLLGVRLRLQPADPVALCKAYREARQSAVAAAKTGASLGCKCPERLWPVDMIDFLGRQLDRHFAVEAYLLDPDLRSSPDQGIARLQTLPADAEPFEANPLHGLIRIDEISAQRGLGEQSTSEGVETRDQRKLSDQLAKYYNRHLDPTKSPGAEDLGALAAIEEAESAFDTKLETSFAQALGELSALGYPGVSDPKVTISTRLRFVDGLDHAAAVQYEVCRATPESENRPLRLPENSNGLGYQNLVSMSFRLMAFRDAWMRVGKAEKDTGELPSATIEPLHLVLVEEPEAYLHPQVQQVFIKKAYQLLRDHDALRAKATEDTEAQVQIQRSPLTTQLIVSTHSSHVAHEVPFLNLRYFRRLPLQGAPRVPASTVINLSNVFGDEDETRRFVTRYVRAYHCDLLFADAAILVEGAAERILLPLFIRDKFPSLSRRYITIMEVGGSHAHRLRNLIDTLGLTALVITDLDAAVKAAAAKSRAKAVRPQRGAHQTTSNPTLKNWLPSINDIDTLLEAEPSKKVLERDSLFAVRVTYQQPTTLSVADSPPTEVIPYTFEDSLVLTNVAFFSSLEGDGLAANVRDSIETARTADELAQSVFTALESGKKAEFALDIISCKRFGDLTPPSYILEGLNWLDGRFEIMSQQQSDNGSV